ncbi:hypothetical protein O988_07226 [Pseudogymnoascus sp. VKM F-3808]|nr:hypothetical protein O988_07226 [Pseudogymnoascus sp. VKM F-3808]
MPHDELDIIIISDGDDAGDGDGGWRDDMHSSIIMHGKMGIARNGLWRKGEGNGEGKGERKGEEGDTGEAHDERQSCTP